MENKASKIVTSDDSALHEPQEGKADDAETQTPKRDYPEPSSSGRVGQPSSANKVETTGVTSNNDDKIKRAGEYMELVFNALGNKNFYEAEHLLKIVNHLDPHANTQLWLRQVQQKNLADKTLGNASESTSHSHIFGPTNSILSTGAESLHISKLAEELLNQVQITGVQKREGKREAEAEAEKQRQEAAEQRMVGLGARDPLRPAARVRFPVSVRALGGFASGSFYVRGMRWQVWCHLPGRPGGPTHLNVSIKCHEPSKNFRPGWRCAARGHVRVLRGGGAGEVEGSSAFDHTFTGAAPRMRWKNLTSRQALAAGPPGRDVTNELILEVELAADPPEYF